MIGMPSGSGVEDQGPLDDFEESQEMCDIYSDRWESGSEGLQLNWLEYRTVAPVVAGSNPVSLAMVVVAQLVERWIVAPKAEGSSPFNHPR